jgi:hypothetical protein
MIMMTEDDIRAEFGWNDAMIYSLLQTPDSPNGRRKKFTGGYTYGLYNRDRVLAAVQSTEGLDTKRRWVRLYVPLRRTQAVRRDSAIWDACWVSRRWRSEGSSSCWDTAPTSMSPTAR